MARALPNRRRRQLEQLELRQMLAGDVTVDVQDGSLMIWGDDDDNALSIVADPRRANTFRIVPQTDTTINGQATTQLVVSGVSSIRATLGGGNDAVLVQGNPRTSLNAIDFRCDDGVDRVYLRQLRVEDSIRVVALEAEHADFITFENVVVDRKAYKIEPAMVVRALGSGSEVNVIQSSFSADVLIEVGHEAYAPEPATGVVGSSGTGKVKIQDLSLYRRFEKANPILRLQAPGSDSEVSVSHSSFEGPVRLEVGSRQASSLGLLGQGAGRVVVEDVLITSKVIDKSSPMLALIAPGGGSQVRVRGADVEGNVLIEVGHDASPPDPSSGVASGGGSGKVHVRDLHFTKWVDKTSPSLMLRALGGGSEVALASSSFEGPVRLEVGSRRASTFGLVGGGAGKVSVNDISITSPQRVDKSWPTMAVLATGGGSEVSVQGADVEGNVLIEVGHDASPADPSTGVASGGGSGKVHVQDLHFHKRHDKLSPELLLRAPGGGSEVSLSSSSFEGPVRLEVGSSEASSLGLVGHGAGKVSVSDISITSDDLDESSPMFAIVAPGGGSAVRVLGADVEGNALIEVGHDASPADSSSGVVSGGGSGKVHVRDLHFTKWVDKTSPSLMLRALGGGSEVTLASSSFEGPVRLEVGSRQASFLGLVGGGAGKVSVSDISISSKLHIDKIWPILAVVAPGGGSQVHVQGADVEGNVLIEVGHDASPSDPTGVVGVATGPGAGKANLQDLHFHKRIDKSTPILLLRAPGGGSEVSVSSSTFEGPVRLEVGSNEASSLGLVGQGAGKVSVSDISITSADLDKSSPILALVAPGGGSEIRVRGADVEGNVLIEVGHEASPPDAATGVGGGMGAGKAHLQDLHFRKWIDKSSPILMLRAPGEGNEVSLSSSSFEGPVRMEVGSHRSRGLTAGGGSRVSITDLAIALKEFDKSSPVLALVAPSGGSEVRVRGADVEGNVLIEVGHEADSSSPPDPASGVRSGMGTGKANLQDLHFHKRIDKSTPILLLRAPGGDSEVSLSNSSFEGPVRLEVGSSEASTLGFSGLGTGKVSVRDLSITADAIDKSSPILAIQAPGSGSRVRVRGATVEGSVSIEVGHEPLPPDSATGVSGGMGAGKAQIQDLHLTKWIDKSSPILMLRAPGGGSDVSVSSSTFDGPVRLEVGSNRASSIGLVGHGAGKVAIQDLSFTRRIDKSTPLLSASLNGGGSQIDVQNVDVPGLARIQLGGSNSVDANLVRSNVARILDSNFGAFDLQSLGEISDRVLVERCLFNGEVSVGLSGGDDYLQVVDSIFSGSVLFDGGDGMDTLVEQGNRFRRPPARLNWEQ